MSNLYSITTNQAAIIALFRVMNRCVGNLPPMPGVFPDYPAPVVRRTRTDHDALGNAASAACGRGSRHQYDVADPDFVVAQARGRNPLSRHCCRRLSASGNGLRVRELWNRFYKPPGAHLPTSHGLSVPHAGAALSKPEHFHKHNTPSFVRA
jgi:hypothetical protein